MLDTSKVKLLDETDDSGDGAERMAAVATVVGPRCQEPGSTVADSDQSETSSHPFVKFSAEPIIVTTLSQNDAGQ